MTDDVEAILAAMTLEEKLAQLVSVWPQGYGAPGEPANVAPLQDEMMSESAEFESLVEHGLGQLTRPLGNRAGTLDERLTIAVRLQDQVQQHSRFGIPAIVHEECLTGLQLYGATTYPTPLAWGSSWDVDLVRSMATQIGQSMRALGIHLGLAPVLDVVRDPRWGRVEECISEDPYLIGVFGTAYVEGVQSAGVGATPKHFLGYSNSRAGRNLAPVHAGPREILEVFAVPFEMVVKQARPSAIMHSYAEIDGVPVAADRAVLTELLRERWGFDGVVVADYFGVSFLQTLHDVAADAGDAAALALTAGVDVELPTGNAYLAPLAKLVADGTVSIDLVDQATRRVLEQKARLGLLSGSYKQPDVVVELDPQASREIARELGERSIVLLDNELLPLASEVSRRIAVIGPNGDAPEAMMGNYSFTNHIVVSEGTPLGINVPTVVDSVRTEFPAAEIRHAVGCAIRADHETEADAAATIAAAVELARDSDVCVAVVGDRAGLFGRGTVGEGSDTDELELPGRQRRLVEALLGTGIPVVVVLITGRPYPVGWFQDRAAAIVQAFFPGEEGAGAIAGVLSGRINPSGRLSVSIPRHGGGQPYSYRHPRLGGANAVSNIDPAPAYAFGHGLSYTTFERDQLAVTGGELDTASTLTVRCRVRNTGSRAGADVVQLYLRDVVASTTRPLRQLLGWARVDLEAGTAAEVEFTVPADRLGFVGRDQRWIVEPGEFELTIAASAADSGISTRVRLGGETRVLGEDRALVTAVRVE